MIDPKVEAPLRKMLGYVMRGEDDELIDLIESIGPQMYEAAAALAIVASGYIAVQVSERWPNEADIRALAKHAADTPGTQVSESEISAYLSHVVVGSESPLDVFDDQQKAAVIPLFATANLLVSYCAQHEDQWYYLDAIWNAFEVADQLTPDVLPATVFRFGRK